MRMIQDFSSPEVKVFSDLTEFFDPRRNKLFIPENRRQKPITTEIHSFLRSLYSRDNLWEYRKLFFHFLFNSWNTDEERFDTFISNILANIPDDKLWGLYFFQLSEAWFENDVQQNLYFSKFSPHPQSWITRNETLGFNSWDPTAQSSICISGNWNEDSLKNQFRDLVLSVCSVYGEKFQLHPTYIFSGFSGYTSNCYLSRYAIYYFLGKTYIGDNNFNYTVHSFLREYENNHDVKIKVKTTGEFSVTLSHVVTKTNKRALYMKMSYTTNPLNWCPWPIVIKGEQEPMLYGVELECSSNYSVTNLVDATDEPFFIVKDDGSVSGNKSYRYEIATIPMSFKAHKKQWAYWFSKLDYEMFDTSLDTTNGMHVHLDKFDTHHQRRFIWFFINPANTEFMLALSERTRESLDQYSKIPDCTGYTKERAYRYSEDLISRQRGIVALNNKGTVEVRLFRGIVSFASLIKNIEAVDSIYEFTKDIGFRGNTLRGYFNFLDHQPKNKYTILKKFFQYSNIDDILSASSLRDLIFNLTDPEAILTKIRKEGFTLNEGHVRLLNYGRPKKNFFWNKKDRRVELINISKGKVAFYDRDLEKRYLRELIPQERIRPSIQRTVTRNPAPEYPEPGYYDDDQEALEALEAELD